MAKEATLTRNWIRLLAEFHSVLYSALSVKALTVW